MYKCVPTTCYNAGVEGLPWPQTTYSSSMLRLQHWGYYRRQWEFEIRNHQKCFLLFLVCLGNTWTQETASICSVSCTEFLNHSCWCRIKHRKSYRIKKLMSRFHIVNKVDESIKHIKLKEMCLYLSMALWWLFHPTSLQQRTEKESKSSSFFSLIEVSLLSADTGAPQHYWLCVQPPGTTLKWQPQVGSKLKDTSFKFPFCSFERWIIAEQLYRTATSWPVGKDFDPLKERLLIRTTLSILDGRQKCLNSSKNHTVGCLSSHMCYQSQNTINGKCMGIISMLILGNHADYKQRLYTLAKILTYRLVPIHVLLCMYLQCLQKIFSVIDS